jgi:hypothetical protein
MVAVAVDGSFKDDGTTYERLCLTELDVGYSQIERLTRLTSE